MAGMRGNRASGRSCVIHGDNGCEIQGEAGWRERAQEKREVSEIIRDEMCRWSDLLRWLEDK